MLWIEQQACDLRSWLAPVSDLGGPAHQAQEWPGFRGVWQGRGYVQARQLHLGCPWGAEDGRVALWNGKCPVGG